MSLNARVFAVVLLAGLPALGGCAAEKQTPPTRPEPVAARAGVETRLRIGQAMDIELPSNASTGYAWEVVQDGSPQLAADKPAPRKEQDTTPPMPGAGGTSRWRYRAVQPGSTALKLIYRRAWEKDIAPARAAEYPVVVVE